MQQRCLAAAIASKYGPQFTRAKFHGQIFYQRTAWIAEPQILNAQHLCFFPRAAKAKWAPPTALSERRRETAKVPRHCEQRCPPRSGRRHRTGRLPELASDDPPGPAGVPDEER